MAYVSKEECLKWAKKATQHILVGYGEDVKGYRIYNRTKNIIITSRDVIVIEDEKNDIATSEKALWIPNDTLQDSVKTSEVSM